MSDVTSRLVERQVHRWSRLDAVLDKRPSPTSQAKTCHRPVITISRKIGSGARIVAKALGERLGMDIFGVSIIDEIARSASLQRRIVDTLDEGIRSDIEQYIDGLLSGRLLHQQEYAIRLARCVTAIAQHGRAIFLGRGAGHILGERADLRVRFFANVETRVKNLMQYENLDEAAARQKIEETDADRARFIKRHFHANVDDPMNYDVCVNTSRIQPEDAVEIVLAAFKARISPECWESLTRSKI